MDEVRSLSALDQEQMNVKRLSREPVAVALPLSPSSPIGMGAFPDALEISSVEKVHHFSPKLSLPSFDREHFGMTLARLQMQFDELSEISTTLLKEDVELNQKTQDILDAEFQKTLEEDFRVKTTGSKWQTWGAVFQYALSAASLLGGAALYVDEKDLTSAAWLLAAGGLGLYNQIMTDTQGWKKLIGYFTESLETRRTVENRIQGAMFVLSMGLMLGGGVAPAQAISLKEIDPLRVVALFQKIVDLGTKASVAATRKSASDIQAKLIILQANKTDLLKDLELLSSREQEMQRGFQTILSVMKQAIENLSIQE